MLIITRREFMSVRTQVILCVLPVTLDVELITYFTRQMTRS
jgi:hypothetical protein